MGDGVVTIALTGDMYLGCDDPSSLFASTGAHLRGADITFGNLEAPISDRGAPDTNRATFRKGLVAFRSEPRMIAALKSGGFRAVGLSNNHSMDCGPEAMLHTLELLDEAKIGHAGAGRDIAEAHEPAIVESKGTKAAFLSYSSVFLPTYAALANRAGIAVVRVDTAYEPPVRIFEQPVSPPNIIGMPDAGHLEAVRQDIRKAKETADLVIVSWHWGVSSGFRNLVPYQVELGHAAIDAGADLVVGHHPHVMQGIEVYKNKVICYSLGNLVFPYEKAVFDKEAFMVKCYAEGKRIQRISFLPLLSELQPRVLDLREGKRIVKKVRQLSAQFGTAFKAEGEEVVIKGSER